MRLFNRAVFASLLFSAALGVANAATWERRSGAYTPTNNNVNITKWQIDSANGAAISSQKMDGEFNHVYQGLNDIEARTNPSAIGNGGLFLTNNGVSTSWAPVTSATFIASSTTRVIPNAAGTISFTTAGATNAWMTTTGLINVAGVSSSAGVTATSLSSFGNASVGALSSAGDVTVTGVVSASRLYSSLVSATMPNGIVTATNVYAASVTTANLYVAGKAANLPVATALISTTSTSCSVLDGSGISGCIRTGLGGYNVSFTTPMANANYKVVCYVNYSASSGGIATIPSSAPNRADSFYTGAYAPTTYIDNVRISCVVFN